MVRVSKTATLVYAGVEDIFWRLLFDVDPSVFHLQESKVNVI
jgi:hypothetical protein